jgi:hypothetical protein
MAKLECVIVLFSAKLLPNTDFQPDWKVLMF